MAIPELAASRAPRLASHASMVEGLIRRVLALSPHHRYVAVYWDGVLLSREREGLSDATSRESDRYEELLVNPTLLKLATQRGNIDCGGLRFLIVGYGNFYQIVCALPHGHLSVAVELSADPIQVAGQLQTIVEEMVQ